MLHILDNATKIFHNVCFYYKKYTAKNTAIIDIAILWACEVILADS